ncbi:MAG TPA: hypothetical protein VH253_02905 [Phycisphaerae bacterium]|nr:hypothetical protein [Phycisphaerae bacterium]
MPPATPHILPYATPETTPSPTRRLLAAFLLLAWFFLDLLGSALALFTSTALFNGLAILLLAAFALFMWAWVPCICAINLFRNQPDAPANAHRACRVAETLSYPLFLLPLLLTPALLPYPSASRILGAEGSLLLFIAPLLAAITLTRLFLRSLLPKPDSTLPPAPNFS